MSKFAECFDPTNCDTCKEVEVKKAQGLNTIWLIQGLDTSEGNTEWETLIVDDTWSGALGKFNRLEHKSNWQEFRPVTAEIPR